MIAIETIIAVLVSTPAGAAGKHLLDAWLSRRAAGDKRDEATSLADATIKTKRIEDDAHIRAELWDRVKKLEENQGNYLRENADLRVKLAERDGVIAQLTQDVHEARAEADEARAQADAARRSAKAAEDRCSALAIELAEVRRMSLR